MKAAILDKTTDAFEGSADVAKKAAFAVANGAKAVGGAAVRSYEAVGEAAQFTGRQIRRKPLVATLSAIGAGFLIGFLIGRKTKG